MRYLLTFSLLFFNLLASNAFITPSELKKSLSEKSLIIIDVANSSLYEEGHITGAIHADISKFVDIESPYSLMNTPQLIQNELKELGINENSKVVIYSHNTKQGVLRTSYLALILLYSGFEDITILDGGYLSWVFENELLTSKIIPNIHSDGNFILNINPNIIVDLKYIKNNLSLNTILDARSEQMYYGVKKSKDVKAIGHIPSSKSSFYMNKFLKDTTLRIQDELEQIYIDGYELQKEDEIIVYSDTAFNASMEFYILYKHMGFKNTKIYEASLLEWGNIETLPITRFKWE